VLSFREHAPHPRLAAHVKCFWTLRGRTDGAPPERILPDGSFELVFHLADSFVRDAAPQPAAMWMGELRRPVLVAPSCNVDVLGVRFRIGGAAAFLRMPMRELADSILPLGELFPELASRVHDARSTRERIAAVEAALLRRMQGDGALVQAAVRAIEHRDGDLRIRNLASALGKSERSLERAFLAQVGIGPKSLARLIRFHAALRGRDGGYFDDAHRIREFHDFAGLTPTEFRREQHAIHDAFVGNLQDSGAPEA
jgi:AraC-like DNA-binding protein